MERRRTGIDFLSLPHAFQKAIINKSSLVTWSRLLRTSKILHENYGKTNEICHLYDHRTLWFVNNKYFLRNSFALSKPTPAEVAEARKFTKNSQFVSLVIHVPRICIMIKVKEHCSLIYGKILTLQFRSNVLHVVDYPKSELPHFSRLIQAAQSNSIWTGAEFTSQKTLLSIPAVSQISRLYLPNKRIDGKTFLSLRSLIIEVDSTNISNIAILQWLKEIQNSERIIQYVKFTKISTYKRASILKKFGGFIKRSWATCTKHRHQHVSSTDFESFSLCYEFQSTSNVSFIILDDPCLDDYHIGLASGFQFYHNYFPCPCMLCVGVLPAF